MFLWGQREILDKLDRWDLERWAADLEVCELLPRDVAEKRAYDKYIRIQHAKAAGHHLAGIDCMKFNSNLMDAQRHSVMYGLHLHEIGLTPTDGVSPEIFAQKPFIYESKIFQSHPADSLLRVKL